MFWPFFDTYKTFARKAQAMQEVRFRRRRRSADEMPLRVASYTRW
jgi:hypothetical protein